MFSKRERNFVMPAKRSLSATTHKKSVNTGYMNSRGKCTVTTGNSLNFYTLVFLLESFFWRVKLSDLFTSRLKTFRRFLQLLCIEKSSFIARSDSYFL